MISVEDLKKFVTTHDLAYDPLCKRYSEAIEQRKQLGQRVAALKQQLESVQADFVRASGVEQGLQVAVVAVMEGRTTSPPEPVALEPLVEAA